MVKIVLYYIVLYIVTLHVRKPIMFQFTKQFYDFGYNCLKGCHADVDEMA